MKDENTFWKENYNIAILPDGRIESVPANEQEIVHYQLYRRLNEKLGKIMGEIQENASSFNLPNILAKMGFINIFPLSIGSYLEFVVIFPFKPTNEQLESLKSLYEYLTKIDIDFFEKPSIETYLNYELLEFGFEDLKKYVEKLKLLSEHYNFGKEKE